MFHRLRVLTIAAFTLVAAASPIAQNGAVVSDKFRQLEETLPTPNEQRTASGAPGQRYWQQRADYAIKVELDDAQQRISGSETVTYYNQSPDPLLYLWVQLDQNIWAKDSDTYLTTTAPSLDRLSFAAADLLLTRDQDLGYRITAVKDAAGAPLKHTIVKTMMRVDLASPLAPGQKVAFGVDWNYKINDSKRVSGRTGAEYFPDDKNYLYEIAQWFPRMAAYNDVSGWQHKQFLGSGEFTLEFGDYRVSITAPSDHVVAATGVLQNPIEVLSPEQRARLTRAQTATAPVLIVTPEEARAAQSGRATTKKTWVYAAQNVRDFAFASSRKFIWDAQGHTVDGTRVMAMSYYPNEGNPLWQQYSTAAIIHTLNVYSRYAFSFPYPTAISVNGPVGGMEYPMICFNGPRPEKDQTHSAQTKYGLISVVIHEVGHNFFPMIVNTDERQWTWMDEGLNSFLQFRAEQEWEHDYPSRRGEPQNIVDYMTSDVHDPIMTNSESVRNLGSNAYSKPATALNILRETILGRDLFDYAFREYSRRWRFKRPMPADFFRTMEDASGVDLDWFWRGWFYGIEHTDISVDNVRWFAIDTQNPDVEKPIRKTLREARPETLSQQRDAALPKFVDEVPSLKDFYNQYDPLAITDRDREEFRKFVEGLTAKEQETVKAPMNFYVVDLSNVGGLVMPVILELAFTDGTKEELRIPAEIWRRNSVKVSKLVMSPKELKVVTLDPHLETADTDLANNTFPRQLTKSRFQLFKDRRDLPANPMQLEKKATTAPGESK